MIRPQKGFSETEALAHLRGARTVEQREVARLRRPPAEVSALLSRHEYRLAEIKHGLEILEGPTVQKSSLPGAKYRSWERRR